jgi:peptide chain release factor subunit 1
MPQAVSSGTQLARRLFQHHNGHPVISLYLDLDPERFATAPARASQIRSLIDQASREIEGDGLLSHEDRVTLREDLERVERFLHSAEAPYDGARSLAIFCSTPDELFETVQLGRPVPGRVVIGRRPYVEPMLGALQRRRWLLALVNRRSAWLWTGQPDGLQEREQIQDNVHGQHDQGGWSQARYERSVEKNVEDHLRNFAEEVASRWRTEGFDRLAVGGPQEIVPRFLELLDEDVRAHLAPRRVEVDLSDVRESQIRLAIEQLVEEDEQATERELLDRLAEGAASGGRATTGVKDTVAALNERRVAQLLIGPGLEGSARRCPTCELLVLDSGTCPADGSELEDLESLREAVVEAALAQDAEVIPVCHYDDLDTRGRIGALLRF